MGEVAGTGGGFVEFLKRERSALRCDVRDENFRMFGREPKLTRALSRRVKGSRGVRDGLVYLTHASIVLELQALRCRFREALAFVGHLGKMSATVDDIISS